MAALTEEETWEDEIYQLETTDPVEGGDDGIDNKQAKQLANRTQYLKAQQSSHASADDPHSQYLQASDVAGANLLINADFSVNQREANGDWSDTDYAWDRTIVAGSDNVGGTVTLSSGKNTSGSYAKITHDSATGAGYIVQRIEEQLSLQGETLAFQVHTNHSLAVSGSVLKLQWFTTDYESASDAVTITLDDISSGDKSSSTTIVCPELDSYDSSNEYFLQATYYYGGDDSTVTADGDYIVEKWKLEVGDRATNIIQAAAINLAKCQRYYQRWYAFLDTYNQNGSAIRLLSSFRTEMRSLPAITVDYTANISCTFQSVWNVSTACIGVYCSSDATGHNTVDMQGYVESEL